MILSVSLIDYGLYIIIVVVNIGIFENMLSI